MAIAGGFIYWANAGTGAITRDTLDGSPANVVDLVTGQNSPSYVALDSSHSYWSTGDGQAGSTIGRANLDGSSPNPSFIADADPSGRDRGHASVHLLGQPWLGQRGDRARHESTATPTTSSSS